MADTLFSVKLEMITSAIKWTKPADDGCRQNDPCRLRVLCQLMDQVVHAGQRSPVNAEVLSGNIARVIGSQKDCRLANFLQNFPLVG
jgi:hypothetical protein